MRNYVVMSLCGWFLMLTSWFCLWVIGYYFVMDAELAILLFPFALRLGVSLHAPKKYWPAVYSAEWFLTISLAILLDQPQWLTVLAASVASIPVIWYAQKYNAGTQWRRLSTMAGVIVFTALLNTAFIASHGHPIGLVFLVSITGGLMLVPSCYLVWSYLFQSTWIPLTANLVSRHIEFRTRHVFLYAVLFVLSIALQVGLPEELRRFAPFCLAIPIILLAFRYGWQGALLGTLLNSVALIAARSGVSNMEVTDLLLSLSAQSLTGILLGIGIQRQRDLNVQLRDELSRNQNLSRQLIKAEESVRKDIARELHDEIGQNITAIRTQASIIKRVERTNMGERCADLIESLSLNVYDTTKGLLTKLRPKTLDDFGLREAVEQLVRDLEFEEHGMRVTTVWLPDDSNLLLNHGKITELSDATNVTVYRICQEALNNVVKYSKATEVSIRVDVDDWVKLSIIDNGVGFKPQDNLKGFGLRGIRERVQALGGQIELQSACCEQTEGSISSSELSGTHLSVLLPIL
ncbi:signal transduction histidine-protein kinase/phosphatase UhpB [Vibrio tapetis]|uniref:Sensory histidine kinase in two-component regulatory sytem with UhpA n=1 Tax=Vibrio tapetis subsp. tapetis TaxID=1671868 RepID=A0A2N8ZN67_9VIBR|nr:signal transduction histidine-protein kinase/phosphatase UhpB [Vibrio tapetis]SON53374.1 sensory histidine kinase in two-component regulatory sytem with UhpA [Vibrio tapetis subsp. tapetis]